MRSVLVADLGGTKCRFALLDEDYEVRGVERVPTPEDRQTLLTAMDGAFERLVAALPPGLAAPTAIGVGTAGVIAPDHSHIEYAPNLPLDAFPLAGHLRERHGLPTTLVNDGRASALGEYRRGHAAGADPLLVLFFGTGIGIGIIVDGRPYEGARGAAGEIGHAPFLPDGPEVPGLKPGSYEALCGGKAMEWRATEAFGPPPSGRPRWRIDEIVAHAAANDRARTLLGEAATAAGTMTAMLCTLLNPSAVVLGGGVFHGWPELRERIETFVRGWCSPAVLDGLAFHPSRGESDAILWGAAAATGAFDAHG